MKPFQIGIIPENQIVTTPNLTNATTYGPLVYHVIDGVTVGELTPSFGRHTAGQIVYSCAVSQAGGIYSSYGPGCYWPMQYNTNSNIIFMSNKVTTK